MSSAAVTSSGAVTPADGELYESRDTDHADGELHAHRDPLAHRRVPTQLPGPDAGLWYDR